MSKEEILYKIMVQNPDGFHDDESFRQRMSEGYGDQIYQAMTEYAHRAIEEAAEEAVGQIGYDHDDQAPSAVRMKQSILKLKEKY